MVANTKRLNGNIGKKIVVLFYEVYINIITAFATCNCLYSNGFYISMCTIADMCALASIQR